MTIVINFYVPLIAWKPELYLCVLVVPVYLAHKSKEILKISGYGVLNGLSEFRFMYALFFSMQR